MWMQASVNQLQHLTLPTVDAGEFIQNAIHLAFKIENKK